ncbi:hypothetical protein WMY93_015054 [Mugilogobius chulae]|uniref:Ferric-chelate reductase 1 n=1 Tax=Mugilogobius chulae TaxID=88201 RepID=A0AAW0P8F0_9GOBI
MASSDITLDVRDGQKRSHLNGTEKMTFNPAPVILLVALCWMSFGTGDAFVNPPAYRNATTSNVTAVNTTTLAPTTTTAAPIQTNLTVLTLSTDITKDTCGKEKLCASKPNDCNPGSGSCFFLGVKRISGRNMDLDLAGETDGYLGAVLKTAAGNETAYLCVRNNGTVVFIGASLKDGVFTKNENVSVNNVKAKMNGTHTQCTFSATVPDATAKGADTTFEVSVVNGTFNATSGQLGAPVTQVKTNSVDLINPAANVPTTTASPTTTSSTIQTNLTVFNLAADLTNTECKKTKLCASKPSGCNPSSGSCFFFSVKRRTGRNMDIEQSGQTEGYLGSVLKTPAGNQTAYLCVRNNGTVIFIGASLNNDKFTKDDKIPVSEVKAKLNSNHVQCTFAATVPDATVRGNDTTFEVSLVTGTYNATSGELGAPVTQFKTSSLDLSDPTSSAVTRAPTTGRTVVPQPMSTGTVVYFLLIVLGVLSLSWL